MKIQRIGDVIRNLTKLRNKHGNIPAVYSSDDEGNNFQHVYFEPTVGKLEENEFEDEVLDDEVNAICIN